MTAADDWPEVMEYLRARDGSNTIRAQSMSLQELSQAPFDVYFHMQRKGDLVILPPRRFGHPRQLCFPLTIYLVSLKRFIKGALQVFVGSG